MSVAVAVVALWLGPLLGAPMERKLSAVALSSRWIAWTVVILVLFALVPSSVAEGGWPAVLAFTLGVGLPFIVEAIARGAAPRSHNAVTWLVMTGLILHSGFDGAAMGFGQSVGNEFLTWSVLVHRIPVGLAVWLVARGTWGQRATYVVLVAMSVATVAGALASAALTTSVDPRMIAWFEAAIAGGLVHALSHNIRGK